VPGSPGAVVNFVDYGDSVGDWASDPGGDLSAIVPANMDHYGIVDQVGSQAGELLPLLAANTHMLAVDNAIDEAVGKQWGAGDAFDRLLKIFPNPYTAVVKGYDTALTAASYAYLGGAALLYHSIAQYASDLSVSLTPTVTPSSSLPDYVQLTDPTASTASLQADTTTTVSADGAVSAPSYTLAADTATKEITSETYTAANDSQYDVSYDATDQISSVTVNNPGGTSYEIFNDDSGQYAWSTRVDFYSSTNAAGTLTGTLYNWHAGGSQLQLFTGLPSGKTEETLDDSQPDATGNPISKTLK